MLRTVFASLLLTVHAQAGKPEPQPRWLESVNPLLGASLNEKDQSWTKMQELCDDIGHRLTGSAQLAVAEDWAVAHLAKDGLQASKETVNAPRWIRGEESLFLLGDHRRELPMLGLGNAVGTQGKPVEAEVMVVTSFEELTARAGEAQGKIILYNVPFTTYGDTVKYRIGGADQASRVGAVAALVRSVGPHSLATPHTGTLRYSGEVKEIPAAAVDIETAEMLARRAARGVPSRVRLTMEARMEGPVTTHNVIGEIKGKRLKDEVVVVGCHLDSWDVGQGAQDDAAGCVAAMEAGRLIAALPNAPARTIRVVLYTNEENGLAGGKTYAAAHEGESIVAAIEMDTGAGQFLGYRLDVRRGEVREDWEPLRATAVDEFQEVASYFSALSPEWLPSFAGADITPLVERGALGVGIHMDTTDYWPIHHTEADTLDKINRDHFQSNIAAMTLMTWVLANWAELPDQYTTTPEQK